MTVPALPSPYRLPTVPPGWTVASAGEQLQCPEVLDRATGLAVGALWSRHDRRQGPRVCSKRVTIAAPASAAIIRIVITAREMLHLLRGLDLRSPAGQAEAERRVSRLRDTTIGRLGACPVPSGFRVCDRCHALQEIAFLGIRP